MTCGFLPWPAHWLTHGQPPAQFPGEGPSVSGAGGMGVTRLFIRRRSPSCQGQKPQRDPWVGVGELPPYPAPPGPGLLGVGEACAHASQPDADLEPRGWAVPGCQSGHPGQAGEGAILTPSSTWPWRQWGGMRGWCPGYKGETGRGLEPAVPAWLGPRPPWLAQSPPAAQTAMQSAWSNSVLLQHAGLYPHQHPSALCLTQFLSVLKALHVRACGVWQYNWYCINASLVVKIHSIVADALELDSLGYIPTLATSSKFLTFLCLSFL